MLLAEVAGRYAINQMPIIIVMITIMGIYLLYSPLGVGARGGDKSWVKWGWNDMIMFLLMGRYRGNNNVPRE